jgi:hypothetical protein
MAPVPEDLRKYVERLHELEEPKGSPFVTRRKRGRPSIPGPVPQHIIDHVKKLHCASREATTPHASPAPENSSGLQPDLGGALNFLRSHYEDLLWCLTAIIPDGKTDTVTLEAGQDQNARELIERWQKEGQNVYYHVNPPQKPISKKAGKGDIDLVTHLHIDLDARKDLDWSDERAVRVEFAALKKRITQCPIPPTTVVCSGGGFQCSFKFRNPLQLPEPPKIKDPKTGRLVYDKGVADEAAKPVEDINRALATALGADAGTTDVSRLLRVPGTINFPNAKKRAAGRVPVSSYLMEHHPERVYDLSDFDALLEGPEGASSSTGPNDAPRMSREELWTALPEHLQQKIETNPKELDPNADRSRYFHGVACELFEGGLSVDQATILMEGMPFVPERYSNRLRGEMQRCYDKWRNEGGQVSETAFIGPNDEATTRDWTTAEPIDAPLHAVPTFNPEKLLPEVFRGWVMDCAYRMPCAPEFIAVSALIAASALIGARCVVKPKRLDNWSIVPNLWGMVVSPPSSKKTPAMNEGLKPLSRFAARAREKFNVEMQEYERVKPLRDVKKDTLKKEFKEAAKAGGGSNLEHHQNKLLLHLARDTKPKLRRYSTNDTTVEKLGEILAENPTGLLVSRDELAGLLASWDREGREGDRAFFLEAWNGDSSFQTDRIGRGSIYIENLCISILGGTQPDKLIAYLEMASNALANDGMLQRFQMLVYPDPVPWEYRDCEPNRSALDKANRVFDALDSFDPVAWGAHSRDGYERFPYFRFDADAQELYKSYLREFHARADCEENSLINQHLQKYEKLLPSLALIFHLIDCAAASDSKPKAAGVSWESVERAAEWCEFLQHHARRCYGLYADQGLRAAQTLASKIKKGALLDGFTFRDVRQHQWRSLSKDDAIQGALDWLERKGWVRPQQVRRAGRPTTRYAINPSRRK